MDGHTSNLFVRLGATALLRANLNIKYSKRIFFICYLFGLMVKKTATWAVKTVFISNWIYSGDDLLFRGLSQSTIGDTAFPCLVRNGTEGDSRSIITRINPANIVLMNQLQRSLQAYRLNKSNDKIKSQWFD